MSAAVMEILTFCSFPTFVTTFQPPKIVYNARGHHVADALSILITLHSPSNIGDLKVLSDQRCRAKHLRLVTVSSSHMSSPSPLLNFDSLVGSLAADRKQDLSPKAIVQLKL